VTTRTGVARITILNNNKYLIIQRTAYMNGDATVGKSAK
jgi:hypothetical protein